MPGILFEFSRRQRSDIFLTDSAPPFPSLSDDCGVPIGFSFDLALGCRVFHGVHSSSRLTDIWMIEKHFVHPWPCFLGFGSYAESVAGGVNRKL